MNLEKIDFKPNIPVDLAFKFSEGKPVNGISGPAVMFTTADGEHVAFLPPIAADKIAALNIPPGEPVRITKAQAGKVTTWQVARVAGEQRDGTFAIPKEQPTPRMASAAPETAAEPIKAPAVNGHGTNFYGSQGRYIAPVADFPAIADRLRTTVNMLVDVQASCLEHAKMTNGGVRPEDVRAILLTAYIGMVSGQVYRTAGTRCRFGCRVWQHVICTRCYRTWEQVMRSKAFENPYFRYLETDDTIQRFLEHSEQMERKQIQREKRRGIKDEPWGVEIWKK